MGADCTNTNIKAEVTLQKQNFISNIYIFIGLIEHRLLRTET